MKLEDFDQKLINLNEATILFPRNRFLLDDYFKSLEAYCKFSLCPNYQKLYYKKYPKNANHLFILDNNIIFEYFTILNQIQKVEI